MIRLLTALLLLGSSPIPPAASPGPDATQAPLVFGAVGYLKGETRKSLEPLVQYLEDHLDRPVRLVIFPGYNDLALRIAENEVDLAILPPILYLNVRDTVPVKTLAYGVYPSGNFTYRAIMLTRKEAGAPRKLEELSGKPVGFVDLFSASGYVVPKAILAAAGVGAKSVVDKFYGNHLDAIRGLQAGEVSAAATYDVVFDQLGGGSLSLDDFHVLATSDPIPTETLVATERLEAATADRIQDLLLSFHALRKDKPEYQKGFYIGFVPPDPSVFSELEKAYRKLLGESGE